MKKRIRPLVSLIVFILFGFASNLLAQGKTSPVVNPTVVLVALYVSLVLGVLVLVAILYIYLRYRKLGRDGIALLVVGVILLGLSVWKQVEFSIGEIKFKGVTQELERIQAAQNSNAATLAQLQQDRATINQELTSIGPLVSNIPNGHNKNELQNRIQRLNTRSASMDGYLKTLKANNDSTQSRLLNIRKSFTPK